MNKRTYYYKPTRDNNADWISLCRSRFDDLSWHALTLRADTRITNASGSTQDLFSDNATHSRDLVDKALSWAITEQRRKEKSSSFYFVAIHGGDRSIGVQPHFHALCGSVSQETIENIARLWHTRLAKAFHLSLQQTKAKEFSYRGGQKIERSSVFITTRQNFHRFRSSVFSEPLRDAGSFTNYCQRFEGDHRDGSSSKMLVNRSCILPTTLSVLPKSHG
jgi:hypothetical protein